MYFATDASNAAFSAVHLLRYCSFPYYICARQERQLSDWRYRVGPTIYESQLPCLNVINVPITLSSISLVISLYQSGTEKADVLVVAYKMYLKSHLI